MKTSGGLVSSFHFPAFPPYQPPFCISKSAVLTVLVIFNSYIFDMDESNYILGLLENTNSQTGTDLTRKDEGK